MRTIIFRIRYVFKERALITENPSTRSGGSGLKRKNCTATGSSCKDYSTKLNSGTGGSKRVHNIDHLYAKNEKESIEYNQVIQNDHDYDIQITPSASKDNELEQYLDIGANTTVKDLMEIVPKEKPSIRRKLGLLWHLRLGHASKTYLESAASHIDALKGVKFSDEILDCIEWKMSKLTRTPRKTIRHRYEKPLMLIHTDLMGPVKPLSYESKNQYLLSFIDDYSRYAVMYSMKSKQKVGQKFEDYLMIVWRILSDSNAKVRFIRTDGGTEYLTNEMKMICDWENIAF